MTKNLNRVLIKLCGPWYNEYIFYRYRIYGMAPWRRWLWRLIFLPAALIRQLYSFLVGHLEIPQLETPVSERCNLKCRDCANLIPFYHNPQDFQIGQLMRDIDDLLSIVDRVHRLIIMGGETFLYPDLNQLISHVLQKDQVGMIHFFTNGTIIPGAETRRLLQNERILVSISAFPTEVAKKKKQLLKTLQEENINTIDEHLLWTDLGGFTPTVETGEAVLKARFAGCCRKVCHNLMHGEYHLCPRSAHGGQLSQYIKIKKDFVNCRNRQDRQVARRELRLLFRREYISACQNCLGNSGRIIPPGIQGG